MSVTARLPVREEPVAYGHARVKTIVRQGACSNDLIGLADKITIHVNDVPVENSKYGSCFGIMLCFSPKSNRCFDSILNSTFEVLTLIQVMLCYKVLISSLSVE